MKYYLIAGEASGDLHGSNLMKALVEKDQDAEFRVWGGELMQAAGGKLVKHYRDLAFMGFVEVVANLRTILRNISFCKKDITQYQPDVIILVDYPGFNLRIAKWAKAQQIKVFYYISPQIWAWRSSRVHKIKRSVDRMFVILPFEKDFYAKYDMEVDFVGHP
ncbi:MAG: lipid-A-disaccharide synthase, partial [Saprospiraceae bacterium]